MKHGVMYGIVKGIYSLSRSIPGLKLAEVSFRMTRAFPWMSPNTDSWINQVSSDPAVKITNTTACSSILARTFSETDVGEYARPVTTRKSRSSRNRASRSAHSCPVVSKRCAMKAVRGGGGGRVDRSAGLRAKNCMTESRMDDGSGPS
jgi:hypothetical protein